MLLRCWHRLALFLPITPNLGLYMIVLVVSTNIVFATFEGDPMHYADSCVVIIEHRKRWKRAQRSFALVMLWNDNVNPFYVWNGLRVL